MWEKFAHKLQKFVDEHGTFDPSRFNDPVAMATAWTSVPSSGPSGDQLVEVHTGRLEYRASLRAKLAFLVFLLIGLAILIVFTSHRLAAGGLSFDKDTILPILIGLALSAGGCYLLYFGTAPVVFDKGSGFFWKGRKSPETVFDGKLPKDCVRLEEIHALQLIACYCSGGPKTRGHYRYEMNLVLKDGQRVNVVVHDNKEKSRQEAGVLALFLDVPLWDALSSA